MILWFLFALAGAASSPSRLELPTDVLRGFEETFRREPAKACARPGAYEYLRVSGRLMGPPIDELCPRFTLFSERGEALPLDFDRLYEVQYVVAGAGAGAASRFGHSMLRFVFCKPRRAPGPDCRKDEFYAVDLGFAAHTDTQNFSVVGGVTGRYPAWVIVSADSDLRLRYLRDELRDLRAYPLKLDAATKRLLLALTVERYWTHDLPYRFLDNNCAGEVLNLLLASLPPHHGLNAATPDWLRPRRLLERLRQFGLADATTEFVWSAGRETLETRLRALPVKARTVPQYIETPASVRRRWLDKYLEKDLSLFASLEPAALRDARARVLRASVKALLDEDGTPTCSVSRTDLLTSLSVASNAVAPSAIKSAPVYEVPREDRLPTEAELSRRTRDANQALARIVECYKSEKKVAAEAAELRAAQENARLVEARVLK